MARHARIVVPEVPHHVIQRGNRRQQTFFRMEDYQRYLQLAQTYCRRAGVSVWAYCLMPNHVHFIAVPQTENSLRDAFAEIHRRYTTMINEREGWTGFLWQGRFMSAAMDEQHTLAAARYIELNPVTAGLVENPGDYPWSSARAHLGLAADPIVDMRALSGRVHDWQEFLGAPVSPQAREEFRKHCRTGRPLGAQAFIEQITARMGTEVMPRKRGRKKRN